MAVISENFGDRLVSAVRKAGNPVLVGIDPRPENLPRGFLDRFPDEPDGVASAFERFGVGVVEAVAGIVPAVKLQAAFFERFGPEGMRAMASTIAEARRRGLLVILDGKRNDIGSTAEAYAAACFGGDGREPAWHVDAATINPYLGVDGVEPFVRAASKSGGGLFVLVRTSNPSAGDFQDVDSGGKPLYRHVADRLTEWARPHLGRNGYGLLGAVAGATYPDQLAELRAAMPGVTLLVPGFGAQGGTAADVAAAFDADGLGAIINSSRGIAFAYERPEYRDRFGGDWQHAVAEAARRMAADLAENTTAGRLRSD